MSEMEARQCTATTKAGARCSIRRVMADGLCFYHSPLAAAQRMSASSAGGVGRGSTKRALKTLPPKLRTVAEKLHKAFEQACDDTLTSETAHLIAPLANALVKVLQAGEMEERMRRVEEQLARQETQRWA